MEFYWDHPRHSVYVNIGTPPVWDGDRVHHIDLDLDVVRLLDDGEFTERRVRYSYPQELIDDALAAATRAVTMLEQRIEPFNTAPDRWFDQVTTR